MNCFLPFPALPNETRARVATASQNHDFGALRFGIHLGVHTATVRPIRIGSAARIERHDFVLWAASFQLCLKFRMQNEVIEFGLAAF